ncbi:MAG: hypothetical protein ACE5GY_09785 [Thermodesulfobacteriota bacterium]
MGEDGERVTVDTFIQAGVFGVVSGAAGAAFIRRYAGRLGLIDAPNERSSHRTPTPRGGGAGLWSGFVLYSVFIIKDLAVMPGGLLTGVLGLVEDRYSLSSGLRLVLQATVAALAVLLLMGVPSGVPGVLALALWTVFIAGTANFYNFMDGANGMAGLTGAVAFGGLALFAFFIAGDGASAAACTFIAFACCGFLPFNIPAAHVFMGDSGSLFLGFEFAFFTARLSASFGAFLCVMMFLSLFYADCLTTLLVRWSRGAAVTEAHRDHLYQYLCNELGVAQWKVSALYAAAQSAIIALSIAAYARGIVWQLAFFCLFCVAFLFVYRAVKVRKPVEAHGGKTVRSAS